MKNKLTNKQTCKLVNFKNKTNQNTGNGYTHRQYLFMV